MIDARNLKRLDKPWCIALLADKNYSVLVVKHVLIKRLVGPTILTVCFTVNNYEPFQTTAYNKTPQ